MKLKISVILNVILILGLCFLIYSNVKEKEAYVLLDEHYNQLLEKYSSVSDKHDICSTELKAIKLKEASKVQDEVIILPQKYDPEMFEGYTVMNDTDMDLGLDNNFSKLTLYCNVGKQNGYYMWDDGQKWALELKCGDEVFLLFNDHIQFGDLEAFLYLDYENNKEVHIVLQHYSSAGYTIEDYVYKSDSHSFVKYSSLESPPNIGYQFRLRMKSADS